MRNTSNNAGTYQFFVECQIWGELSKDATDADSNCDWMRYVNVCKSVSGSHLTLKPLKRNHCNKIEVLDRHFEMFDFIFEKVIFAVLFIFNVKYKPSVTKGFLEIVIVIFTINDYLFFFCRIFQKYLFIYLMYKNS